MYTYTLAMPNITVYIPKELKEALDKRPDINRSKIVAAALKKAVESKPKEKENK